MRILALHPQAMPHLFPDEHVPLFPERRAGTLFPLGLALAAEALSRAHEVECVDENVAGRIAPPFAHDLLAVHAGLATLPRIRALFAATRGTRTRILAGGPLVTAAPDLVAASADILLLGEAEPATEPLLRAISCGGTGIRIGPNGRATRLHAPSPRFFPPGAELLPYELSRGCKYDCRFCGTPVSFPGGRIAKPPERVAAEIASLAGHAPAATLFVTDDDAAADPDLFEAFLGSLSAAGMRAVAKARADSLAALPPDADLSHLDYLNVVLRERPEDPDPAGAELDLVRRLARRRLRVEVTLLVGHPGDDEARLARFAAFLRGLPVTKVCLLPLMPLPHEAEGGPCAPDGVEETDAPLRRALRRCGLTPDLWRAFVARVREGMRAEGFAALKAALAEGEAR